MIRAVEKLVSHSPQSLNLPFTTWSAATIAAFMTEVVECSMCRTTAWKALKGAGYSYRKVQDKFIFKDPLYDLKRAQLTLLRRYFPDSFRLIFIDEKGPVHAVRYSGRCWSPKPRYRERRQPSLGKIKFLGAYDPQRDLLYMEPMIGEDSKSFCEALTTLTIKLQDYPWRKLIIVLDNDSTHNSHYTKEYWAADPRIEFFFLPTYSPELNPIEPRFKFYCAEFLNVGHFTSAEEIIDGTSIWCEYYNSLRKEIHCRGGISVA